MTDKITIADLVGHLERARQDTERLLSVEADRAAEMEAQANREKDRADAAERMVVELRAKVQSLRSEGAEAIREAYKRGIGDGHPLHGCPDGVADVIADFVGPDDQPALSSTADVAGRWCHVAERDAAIAARDELQRTAVDVYEARIREIADDVMGLVPPHTPTVVLLDAIERRCNDERMERVAAERARDEAVKDRLFAEGERDAARDGLAELDRHWLAKFARETSAHSDAERARDEVGIQLAAAQERIKALETVADAVRFAKAGGLCNSQVVDATLAALDTVQGDALATDTKGVE